MCNDHVMDSRVYEILEAYRRAGDLHIVSVQEATPSIPKSMLPDVLDRLRHPFSDLQPAGLDSRATPVIHYPDHPGGRSGRYRTSN